MGYFRVAESGIVESEACLRAAKRRRQGGEISGFSREKRELGSDGKVTRSCHRQAPDSGPGGKMYYNFCENHVKSRFCMTAFQNDCDLA